MGWCQPDTPRRFNRPSMRNPSIRNSLARQIGPIPKLTFLRVMQPTDIDVVDALHGRSSQML